MAEPMFIGVDIDGLPGNGGSRRARQADGFRVAAEAGVFDFVEIHASAAAHLKPFFELVDRYALPIRVIDGTWGVGGDEANAKDLIDAGSRVGGKVLNVRLAGRRDDAPPSDEQLVAFWLQLCEWGERAGCVPSLDACFASGRDRTRIARLGDRLALMGAPFRVTLDHSDLLIKEEALQAPAAQDADTMLAGTSHARAVAQRHADWIDRGWVCHVRTRGALSRSAGKGRAGTASAPGERSGSPAAPQLWAKARAEGWRRGLHQLIHWQASELRPRLRQITCAFASPAGRRNGAGLDALRDNVACARWLRDLWLDQMEARYGGAPPRRHHHR
ncbi:hypothetical protein WJ542_19620 [Paraburkholderia sp. B3]|uniref:hypothetical protein n=1 Tax=Paraburkholderia sp. B3 TaxID=3134791 RepID=UPI003981A868